MSEVSKQSSVQRVAVAGCHCAGCESIRRTLMWSRYVLPLPCPVCNRFRLEYFVDGDALFLRCPKCGADHDAICEEAIRLAEQREASNQETHPYPEGYSCHLAADAHDWEPPPNQDSESA